MEQWACSRVHPTFVITTFTGLPQHSVYVGVLSVPTDEEAWSPRLRVYLKAISQFHSRKKETSLGTLMVTNLSGFPSALTVIAVPGGDIKSHRENFIVNENLKRLGCSGRAGMTLTPPTGATLAKYIQLYHTSDRVNITESVIELVRLCQIALVLFTKLASEYADGLLCDVTERAVNDWWTEVGLDYFNVEPGDGILGPTTVAALLGMLVGARNRLNAYGAPVAKDVFDISATKRGIAYFQKSQKLQRSRRLDRQTLDRLHRVTSKAASGEGWAMPKAVKSTVVELSGKGGEMVMGMVGGRDRAGIAEIETLNIEVFVRLVSGETSKWLWYGKPRKTNNGELFNTLTGEEKMVFSEDENAGYIWSSRKRDSVTNDTYPGHSNLDPFYMQQSQGSQATIDPSEKDQALRRTVLKSVTGKMSDARSGLGRIKGAVGLRGHNQKYSKDEDLVLDNDEYEEHCISNGRLKDEGTSPPLSPRPASPLLDGGHAVDCTTRSTPMAYPQHYTSETEIPRPFIRSDSHSGLGDIEPLASSDSASIPLYIKPVDDVDFASEKSVKAPSEKAMPSRSNSIDKIHHSDNYQNPFALTKEPALPTIRSTQSYPQLPKASKGTDTQPRWPRNLSFGMLDEILQKGSDQEDSLMSDGDCTLEHALATEQYNIFQVTQMMIHVWELREQDSKWVKNKVYDIEELDSRAGRDQKDLDAIHYQKMDEYDALQEITADLMAKETTSSTELLREIEVLGAKLDYEMEALQSKVDDMVDGVNELERQVIDIEGRIQELEDDELREESWFSWIYRIFSGRGK